MTERITIEDTIPELTPDMLDEGESVILAEVGGVEGLSGYFDARELATSVYLAMVRKDGLSRNVCER
jgi:hypothetical protein